MYLACRSVWRAFFFSLLRNHVLSCNVVEVPDIFIVFVYTEEVFDLFNLFFLYCTYLDVNLL